jgi:GT2 family glycosyltransferase
VLSLRTEAARRRCKITDEPGGEARSVLPNAKTLVNSSTIMDLSVVIVNWNSADFLLECVASIQAHTQNIAYEIIVVDNASAEEDVDKLRQHVPQIKIIRREENLGFARANNLGFRHSTGEFVLFLNPDTKLVSPAINIMLGRMKSLPDAGIVGCRLLNTDLSVQLSSIQKFPTILNQVLDLEYLQLRWPHCPLWEIAPLFSDGSNLASVEVVSGACMLLRRRVFEQVGMFSEDYFMYAEDVDLNYRVKRSGLANYYVGEATIVHYGGGSSSRQEVNHWATIMKYRAMRRLFGKTRGRLYGSLFCAAMGCAAVGRLTLLAFAYPLGSIVWKRESMRVAMQKWRVILKWAIGWQGLALEDR